MARRLRTRPGPRASRRKQFVDNIVAGPKGIIDLWKLMNISNDRFIRTTDDYHVEAIQKIFTQDV